MYEDILELVDNKAIRYTMLIGNPNTKIGSRRIGKQNIFYQYGIIAEQSPHRIHYK